MAFQPQLRCINIKRQTKNNCISRFCLYLVTSLPAVSTNLGTGVFHAGLLFDPMKSFLKHTFTALVSCLTNHLQRRALPPSPACPGGLLLRWSNSSLVTSMHCLKASHHLDHLGENVFWKRERLRNRDLHLGPQGNYQMANGLFSLDESEQLNQADPSSLDFISNQPFCFTSWRVCFPPFR